MTRTQRDYQGLRARMAANPEYREKRLAQQRMANKKYETKPERRDSKREWTRERMMDPAFKEKANAREKERHRNFTPEKREYFNLKRKARIENNPDYYADRNKRAREKYRSDPELRAKIKASNYLYRKRRKAIDPDYRAKRAAAVHMRAKRRRAIDQQFKIRVQLFARLHAILRRARVRKSARTQTLIGCQYSTLMRWLEASFQPGMTWANHGPIWHIDHKRPCASYDLTKRDEQLKCFHYTNLQPLFVSENILKSSWYNGKLHRHEKAAA